MGLRNKLANLISAFTPQARFAEVFEFGVHEGVCLNEDRIQIIFDCSPFSSQKIIESLQENRIPFRKEEDAYGLTISTPIATAKNLAATVEELCPDSKNYNDLTNKVTAQIENFESSSKHTPKLAISDIQRTALKNLAQNIQSMRDGIELGYTKMVDDIDLQCDMSQSVDLNQEAQLGLDLASDDLHHGNYIAAKKRLDDFKTEMKTSPISFALSDQTKETVTYDRDKTSLTEAEFNQLLAKVEATMPMLNGLAAKQAMEKEDVISGIYARQIREANAALATKQQPEPQPAPG